ncbi:response regulator transcription factor [Mesorhizobium sp. WSM2239]|uniref:Response regulator transcription factor n=2 Tax=unclassified Mesorhizobium TaxID=325217 RepID=A0AAU8DI57_9HYPH
MIDDSKGEGRHRDDTPAKVRPLILIASQDLDFYLMLDHILRADDFRTALMDGADERARFSGENIFAIILDCRADSSFAADTYRQLKDDAAMRNILSIALLGPGAEQQHVELLKLGVDESFVRPIAPARLLLSLRARRSGVRPGYTSQEGRKPLVLGDLEMSLETYRVHRDGKEIHLGPIEFRLLRHLIKNPGRVFSRNELIASAWPKGVHVSPRTVDMHISRLRSSLTRVSKGDLIRTVRSAGYSLEEPESC